MSHAVSRALGRESHRNAPNRARRALSRAGIDPPGPAARLVALATVQRRIERRNGWRCTFPGCTSYGNLHDHHLDHRSRGGSDELANRTTLCVWHHLRGEHAQVVRCRGRAPARYRSGDVCVS